MSTCPSLCAVVVGSIYVSAPPLHESTFIWTAVLWVHVSDLSDVSLLLTSGLAFSLKWQSNCSPIKAFSLRFFPVLQLLLIMALGFLFNGYQSFSLTLV